MKKSYYSYERQHKWYLDNRELCLSRAKAYRIANREAIRIKDRAYKKAHPDLIWISRNCPKYRFSGLKTAAKRRDLEMGLCFEEYLKLVSKPCYYCGGKLPEKGHGIDRIHSNKGYVRGNVRPCCTNCNLAKNDLSSREFLKLVTKIYKLRVSE